MLSGNYVTLCDLNAKDYVTVMIMSADPSQIVSDPGKVYSLPIELLYASPCFDTKPFRQVST